MYDLRRYKVNNFRRIPVSGRQVSRVSSADDVSCRRASPCNFPRLHVGGAGMCGARRPCCHCGARAGAAAPSLEIFDGVAANEGSNDYANSVVFDWSTGSQRYLRQVLVSQPNIKSCGSTAVCKFPPDRPAPKCESSRFITTEATFASTRSDGTKWSMRYQRLGRYQVRIPITDESSDNLLTKTESKPKTLCLGVSFKLSAEDLVTESMISSFHRR
ncbi:hypothetical protein EVAR_5508_1 [Eumeta japonica]|uniref:Uncharacterized protein n=1 Tax=Eumeta variegata TaxID=151549 RepID=A0A4C1TC04_EUMVA|nr:hypothetical protein EVAR_5508_1 [Eumeta japonica]